MRAMKLSNRALTWLAITPSAIYVIGLAGMMATRLLSGHQPLPNGTMPAVMVLNIVIPMASIAAGTVMRLRRDA